MLPLETKLSGVKILPQSDLKGGVFLRGNVMQALRRAEETSQLQDWNLIYLTIKTLINLRADRLQKARFKENVSFAEVN
jgi:hypothetical protein